MFDAIPSKNNISIRLSDERWAHIVEEHGELFFSNKMFWTPFTIGIGLSRGTEAICLPFEKLKRIDGL